MKREPNLELLLRGEVLALSSLDYASQRQAMLEALHDVFRGRYGQRDGTDPGIALIEALAAALDVLGLYHDRFLTESKLGSAVRLQSVARLAEAVGYVPSPRLAARALQFFEAKAEAILPRGTKVAGKPPDAAGNVVFETTGSLSIAPAFNRLPIAPLVTRHADASRVVIELATAPERGRLADLTKIDKEFARAFHDLNPTAESEQPTPRDDFQPGFLAMVNGLFGLELAGVEEARSGAIALQRGLRASYDPSTTFLHAATQVRHLRMWRPLGSWPDGASPGADEGPELVVFELAERPILHYPDATVPGGLRSSLEVFVFEGTDDPGLPSSWPREDAWTEVPDFSASEASDRHYRTFVDDRLHTYLILRRRLGYRVLLSDDALCRVFVRYTPAVGAIESWQGSDGLEQYRAFKLDQEYFKSSLVCPTLELKKGEATNVGCTDRVLTWAVTAEPLGLGAKDQILIKDTESDRIFIRTLTSVRGRYVSWAASTLAALARSEPQFELEPGRSALSTAGLKQAEEVTPHEQYLPLSGCFHPKKTELMPLRDAASGQRYPFWEEFYNRVDVPEERSDPTIVPKGSIFLFLEDASQVKPGDFFLIGTRSESQDVSSKAPWITAEVVQAQEVHGGLVRLRYPTAQQYPVGPNDGYELPPGTIQKVLAVPLVASVYYGDRFTQTVSFDPDTQSIYANNCRVVMLDNDHLIDPELLREIYDWTIVDYRKAFENLFLAVAGYQKEAAGTWTMRVHMRDVVVRGHVSGFINNNGISPGMRPPFNGVAEPILLHMDTMWRSVDAQGQVELYAILYHGREWSGDDLQVFPEPPVANPEFLWLELAGVSTLLGTGHRLTLTCNTNVRIREADYDSGSYRIEVPHLDIEKTTTLSGVQWKVSSGGMTWSQHVATSGDVHADNEFHLQVVESDEEEEETAELVGAAEEEEQEDRREIRLTIKNDPLFPGDEIRVTKAGNLLGNLRVIEPKGTNGYYVVEYSGDMGELPESPSGTLIWGNRGDWLSKKGTLVVTRRVSPEGEGLWLTFPDRSFFGIGFLLNLEIVREVSIESVSQGEDLYLVENPGFDFTKVTARGVRWTNRIHEGESLTDDDFRLISVVNEVRLTVIADYLQVGDELELRDDHNASTIATVSKERGEKKYYVLSYNGSVPLDKVSELILRRVRIREEISVHLKLPAGTPDQRPWVLSFKDSKSAPLESSILIHSTPPTAGAEIDFKPENVPLLLKYYADAGVTQSQPSVHVLTNMKSELCAMAYNGGSFPSGDQEDRNFFTSTARLGVDLLLVNSSSKVFPDDVLKDGRSILICDMRRLPRNTTEMAAATFVLTGGLNTYSQSIVFNSGNFIPVSSGSFTPASDDGPETNNVSFSLHLTADDKELKFKQNLETVEVTQTQYFYNVNKTPEGVFTINALVNKAGLPPLKLYVEVEYAATRVAHGQDDDPTPNKIYEFETEVHAWEPSRQLVLLDSGNLKTGDYLFLHTGPPDEGVLIQWTRVDSIRGRTVSVEPPLDFEFGEARRYSLHGLAKVPKPQALDPEYYKLLSEAVLDASVAVEPPPVGDGQDPPTGSYALALGDQLPLDPLVHETLLESLIPGDHLLIWDERWRQAWRKFRASGEDNEQTEPESWFDWPDYQHEAIVKSVDAEIGLVVLEEPLPARFRVVYDYTAAKGKRPRKLCPRQSNYQSLRVLPYYRAPFQGARELIAIGSGNQAKKFPRYLTEIGRDIGLASVPLDVAGTLVSNVEALARDPRSNKWSRWTQFQTIDTAKGGDAAFTMGIELTADQPDTVALSVSFGDGRNGALLPTGADNVYIRTTSVGRWHAHLQKRWPLKVLEERSACAPFATPGTGAMQPNLCLLVEFGDHAHWRPTNGGWPWRPSMTVRLTRKVDRESSTFREITCEEARRGHDGIWVSSYRPGVVQVFFFSRETLSSGDMDIDIWAEPQSRVWSLDGAFYEAVANPEQMPGPESSAQIALLETRGLRAGSLLAFERDDDGDFELATVKEVQHETYSATLTAPLGRAYSLGKSTLRGNLVHVEEGESERQYIGSGDGKTANLRIPLHVRKPVVYSLDESSSDPLPGVQILVDGVTWELRDELGDSGPRDRVYRLDRDPAGALTVEFGDGRNGAIPSRGTDNIEAILRSSPGAPANVGAGGIDKLRDGNLAVASTRNLLAAAGGREAESPSQARDTLRQRGLPYSRAITAEDIARLALEVGEVIHARVDPTAAGVVRVVVALDQRRQPDAAILGEVHGRLQPQLPVTAGATIEVVGAEQRPVHIVISDIAVEPGYREGDVLTALNEAFAADGDGFFAPRHWSIGRALRLGDLYEALFAVRGVSAARVRWMSLEKPPLDLPDTAGETVEAGPRGVIRCDDRPDGFHQERAPRPANAKKKAGNNDSDAPQDRGSLRFELGGGRP